MAVLTAPIFSAALLLMIAGVAKMAKPRGTVIALKAVGIHAPAIVVTMLGGVELILGVCVIVWTPPLAIAVMGVFYTGFAAFSAVHLSRNGANASCGCFGEADTPVHLIHVFLNVGVVALCIGALYFPPTRVNDVSITVGFATLVLTGTLFTMLTALPQTMGLAHNVLKSDDA